MNSTTVLGEGAYGCVHAPALSCADQSKNDKINETFKHPVSKLMTTHNANGEMAEYNLIDIADPINEYYLGKPISCVASGTSSNVDAAKKCESMTISDQNLVNNLQHYSLLIMENGGLNLDDFARSVLKDTTKTPLEKRPIIERFFIDLHHILKGLKMLYTKGIVHHDMKPQNIVYDSKTRKMNFIDFGLMTTGSDMVTKSINDLYPSPTHWSYPLEILAYNKSTFNWIANVNVAPNPTQNAGETVFRLVSNNYRNLKSTIQLVYQMNNNERHVTLLGHHSKTNVFNSFVKTIENIKVKRDFDNFISKSVQTFDTYGLGIGLLTVMKLIGMYIEPDFAVALSDLFYNMCTLSVNDRYDIYRIISTYEDCLERFGILQKHNVHIENNTIVDGPTPIKDIMDEIENGILTLSSPEQLEKLMSEPPKEQTPGNDLIPNINPSHIVRPKTPELPSTNTSYTKLPSPSPSAKRLRISVPKTSESLKTLSFGGNRRKTRKRNNRHVKRYKSHKHRR